MALNHNFSCCQSSSPPWRFGPLWRGIFILYLVPCPTPQMFSQAVLRTSSCVKARFHFSPSGFSPSLHRKHQRMEIRALWNVEQQSHQWDLVLGNNIFVQIWREMHLLMPAFKGKGQRHVQGMAFLTGPWSWNSRSCPTTYFCGENFHEHCSGQSAPSSLRPGFHFLVWLALLKKWRNCHEISWNPVRPC